MSNNNIYLNNSFKLKYAYDEEQQIFIGVSAFGNLFKNFIIPNFDTDLIDFGVYFNSVKPKVYKILSNELKNLKAIKANFFFRANYTNVLDVIVELNFKTQNKMYLESTDFDLFFDESMKKILFEQEVCASHSSGWHLHSILSLEVRTNKYNVLKMNCGVRLPPFLASKHAVISPASPKDGKCFFYSILSKYNKSNKSKIHPINIRRYSKKYNWDINFPTSIQDVKKWERINSNCSVSIFAFDADVKSFYAIKLVEVAKPEHFNLLIITNSIDYHFCLITDLSKLLSSSISKNHLRTLFCLKCMCHFKNPEILNVHVQNCAIDNYTSIRLPKKNSFVEFKNKQHFFESGFYASCDLECLCTKIITAPPSTNQSFTHYENLHIPYAFGFCLYSTYSESQTSVKLGYTSKFAKNGVIRALFDHISEITRQMDAFYNLNYPMDETIESYTKMRNAKSCEICAVNFSASVKKYRHHHHSLAENNILMILCNSCNLSLRDARILPVYFVGGRNYDFSFIISELHQFDGDIRVLPDTSEKMISIILTLNNISVRLLDFCRFINMSLKSLNECLPFDRFLLTKNHFPHSVHPLVTKKCLLFYDWLDSYDKLEQSELPSRELCTNKLTGELPTESEYADAQTLFAQLNCTNVLDYVSNYLAVDVLTTLDNFLYYRALILSTFQLDIGYYFSMPGVAYDLMLLLSREKIELISDCEVLDFCMRCKRGGVCTIVRKYAEASPTDHIFIYDSNSNYATVQLNSNLAVAEYEFISPHNFDYVNVDWKNEFGYFVEVDICFDQSVHDALSDLPILPHRKKTSSGHLKLILDLEPKVRYVLFIANLQMAIKLGATVQKVHRVLRFKQKRFMAPFIQKCLDLRSNAKDDAMNILGKLLMCASFGKTIQNPLKQKNIKVINKTKDMLNAVRRPDFIDRILLNDSLAVVSFHKSSILYNKIPLVGVQILELAKVDFFSFFYFALKKQFGDRVLALGNDTDSHTVLIKSNDIVAEIKNIKGWFDHSNLDPSDPLFSLENRKKCGFWKSETGSKKILKFVGVKPKLYSFLFEDQSCKNKAKGVLKRARDLIKFQNYYDCIMNNTTYYAEFYQILSKQFKTYTAKVQKIAISPNCDKRHFYNKTDSLPFGHYRLEDEYLRNQH